MNTLYLMYPEVARHEIDRRLRAADQQRRRRLARHQLRLARHSNAETMRR